MEDNDYLERRRQLQANRPKWTLFHVIHVWLEWRYWVAVDREIGREPIDFLKFANHWAGMYAEKRISK